MMGLSRRFSCSVMPLAMALFLFGPACGEGSTTSTSGGSSEGATGSETGHGTNESADSSGPAPTTVGTAPSTGTTGTGPQTSGDTTAGASCPSLGDPCTECESSMCPVEYCACFDNGSCGLLAQCTAGCAIDDMACNQACWSMHPDGISDGALLTHCAATICSDACGPYVPLTPCQLCLYTECPEEMNQCVANPDCTALLECLDACETPGCENTCYTAFPGGLADSGPVGLCGQDHCAVECA